MRGQARSRGSMGPSLGAVGAALSLGLVASCSNAKVTTHQSCDILSGTSLSLASPTAGGSDLGITSCWYASDGSSALLNFYSLGQMVTVFFSGAPSDGVYQLAASNIQAALDSAVAPGGWYGDKALKFLAGSSPGRAMVSTVQTDPRTHAVLAAYDSAAEGRISLRPPGRWPSNVGELAATAFIFEAAPQYTRTSAAYGTPPQGPPATLSGSVRAAIGRAQTLDQCASKTPEPGGTAGGAGCVDFQTQGPCSGDSDCVCDGARCFPAEGGGGKCLVPFGGPCGSAGGGYECGSGFCNSSGHCDTPKPESQCVATGGSDPCTQRSDCQPIPEIDYTGNPYDAPRTCHHGVCCLEFTWSAANVANCCSGRWQGLPPTGGRGGPCNDCTDCGGVGNHCSCP